MFKTFSLAIIAIFSATMPALAHVGVGTNGSFATGFLHPFSGFDHMAAMVAVGLWASLKGGKATWIWPCAFVAVMLFGGAFGMALVPIPFVEPGILASVIVLGLLVALAVDLPIWIGGIVVGMFALFHGHAHGTEVPETAAGIAYMAGFAIATAGLHLTGIGAAIGLARLNYRPMVRIAGATCVLMGVGLSIGMI